MKNTDLTFIFLTSENDPKWWVLALWGLFFGGGPGDDDYKLVKPLNNNFKMFPH